MRSPRGTRRSKRGPQGERRAAPGRVWPSSTAQRRQPAAPERSAFAFALLTRTAGTARTPPVPLASALVVSGVVLRVARACRGRTGRDRDRRGCRGSGLLRGIGAILERFGRVA